MRIYWTQIWDDCYQVNTRKQGDRHYNIVDVADTAKSGWEKAEKLAGDNAVYTTIPDWASDISTIAGVKSCYLVPDNTRGA